MKTRAPTQDSMKEQATSQRKNSLVVKLEGTTSNITKTSKGTSTDKF